MISGVEIIGEKEMAGVFSRLSNIEAAEFFLQEFKPAADMMITAIKNQAPVYQGSAKRSRLASRTHAPGTLKASIGKRIAGDQFPTVFVGPNRKNGVDGWYDHIVIGGHEYGGTRVAPNPFVRRAYDAAAQMIQTGVTSKIKLKMKKLIGT